MRPPLQVVVTALVALLLHVTLARSQAPEPQQTPIPDLPGQEAPAAPAVAEGQVPAANLPFTPTEAPGPLEVIAPATVQIQVPGPNPLSPVVPDEAAAQKNLELLRTQMEAAQAGDKQGDTLQKKVELLQKQIEIQQKMIKLLLDNMQKPKAEGPAVEALQTKIATLDARSQQAVQRDVNVQQAIDNITEHIDAVERNGPRLPATLKELFLPSRTNETPVSIYGQFLENFTQFNSKPGTFSSPDFSPYFFVQLNDQFLLAANIDIKNGSVAASEIQIDWFATDWMTVVVGRYLDQIGYFNERLNHEWINRLPDPPLMFRQVSPLTSTDGIMLRGGVYLGCTPIKLEYSLYGGNGLQAGAAPVGLSKVADFENITGGPDATNLKAMGGRLGLVVPEWGLSGGVSAYFNGRYSSAFADQFNLWQLDLGYRHDDLDLRFEYAETYQQAASYIGNNIRRKGLYAQIAYRPSHLDHCILSNLEVAVRYSRVWFRGIDPAMLDPTVFAGPVDVPVNRDQWTFGINYYFYPSMALRFAYEFNREFDGINLHDSEFLGQFVWAF